MLEDVGKDESVEALAGPIEIGQDPGEVAFQDPIAALPGQRRQPGVFLDSRDLPGRIPGLCAGNPRPRPAPDVQDPQGPRRQAPGELGALLLGWVPQDDGPKARARLAERRIVK